MRVTISRIKIAASILFIMGVFYVSQISFAENEIMLQESDITTTTIPENPQPYDDVTINLSSYATDLNKAMIQWQNGSSIVLSGYGKTSYSFKTSGPNTISIIDVTITIPGSIDKVTKRIAINPSEVELIWEGVDSYTPPFYRGKSFPSPEGRIKVVAVPNTNIIKQGKGAITYTWKSGNNTVQSASGYNKDSYVFQNSELNDVERVSVTAESVNGVYNATNSIEIPITAPKIIFYEKSPTQGILYNAALGKETSFNGEEMTIVAEPYFLALKGNEDSFSYNWKINGKIIDTPSRKTELTIRPTDRGGYATLELSMENLSTLFQKVIGQLKLDL